MPMGLTSVVPGGVVEAAWHNSVADRIVGRFATTAERDAAITAPVNGMVVAITTPGLLQVRRGGAWKLAAPVPVSASVAVTVGQDATGASVAFGPVLTLPDRPDGADRLDGTFTVSWMLGVGTAGATGDWAIRVRTGTGGNAATLAPAQITFTAPLFQSLSFTSRWNFGAAPHTLQMLVARNTGSANLRIPADAGNLVAFTGNWVAS